MISMIDWINSITKNDLYVRKDSESNSGKSISGKTETEKTLSTNKQRIDWLKTTCQCQFSVCNSISSINYLYSHFVLCETGSVEFS